jgi:tetratricopeptide (TPR) repeat protein
LKKSIELFQQAIAADPNYALAYTGLADTYNVAPSYAIGISSKQGEQLADTATLKALQLDDSLSEAHGARGMALCEAWRFTDAEAEFRRAIALNPNNSAAHYFYALVYLGPMKRMDESLAEFQKALSLDPLSSIVASNYALTLMAARRYLESLAEFQKVLERDPNFAPAHFKLSQLYSGTGRFAEAIAELQKSGGPVAPRSPDAKGFREQTLMITGTDRSAQVAVAYALEGDRDKAFEYLQKAYADGDNELLFVVRFPALDPLRTDARYKDLMRRLGLPE